jgi:hypothetical protein
MNLFTQLQQARSTQFVALVLDNEVTVGEFVTEPALPWRRIIQIDGNFQIGPGYPSPLTSEQAKFEMKNWDQVSLPGIVRTLSEIGAAVDCVVIGNNAGQGVPLAQALPRSLRASRGAIIYATSLPEQSIYEQLGYRSYFRRSETSARLLELAKQAARPLALYFINTIQHNERNYHDP